MLKYTPPKTPAAVEPAKGAHQAIPLSTGIATPAEAAPISSSNDPLTSVLNSLQALLTPHDPETLDCRVSTMRAAKSALTLNDERRLLASIFPSLDGRVWERNLERAEGRGETLTSQLEEAIQFYFDNYLGYS